MDWGASPPPGFVTPALVAVWAEAAPPPGLSRLDQLRDEPLAPKNKSEALAEMRASLTIAHAAELQRPPPYPVQEGALTQLLSAIRDGGGNGFDGKVEAVFPFRSPADPSLRRLRFTDCVRYLGRPRALQLVNALAGWCDYVWLCCLAFADRVLAYQGEPFVDFLRREGLLPASVGFYSKWAKAYSDCYKGLDLPDIQRRVEIVGLVGYRNLPFEGFDPVAEARLLAEGGGKHGWDDTWMRVFRSAVSSVACTTPRRQLQLPFRDYLWSGEWLTAGSSSIGRVNWRYGGEKGHFKARKNMVPLVADLDVLENLCRTQSCQENVALIKNELSKVRVAVAGDIVTYLQMSYVCGFLQHCYADWRGYTGEEDPEDNARRWMRLEDTPFVGLPFDYAAFDHQPTTDEVRAIYDTLIDRARPGVMVESATDFELMASLSSRSFVNAYLTVRESTAKQAGVEVAGDQRFRVTGGLNSGLYITALVGSLWNATMAQIATWIMDAFHLPRAIDIWVRGDDTAVFAASAVSALAYRRALAVCGAEGNSGKFRIERDYMEFLRVEFRRDRGCRAWAARAIPGLVQRKPWSSEPWEEDGLVRALHSTVGTLCRRTTFDAGELWACIKVSWSRRNRASHRWLGVPVHLGGVGLEDWDGGTGVCVKPARPLLDLELGPSAVEFVKQDFVRHGLELPDYHAVALARLRSTISRSDVPGLPAKPIPERGPLSPARPWAGDAAALGLGAQASVGPLLGFKINTSFKMMRRDLPQLQRLSTLATQTRVKLSDLVRQHLPHLHTAAARLTRKYHCRLGVAYEWLTSGVNLPTFYSVSPAVSGLIESWVIYGLESRRFPSFNATLGYICYVARLCSRAIEGRRDYLRYFHT